MDDNFKYSARVLEAILNKGRIIEEKTAPQYRAFQFALLALEKTNLTRETAIIRYHAANLGASVFQDKYTREAISAAIRELNKMSAKEG